MSLFTTILGWYCLVVLLLSFIATLGDNDSPSERVLSVFFIFIPLLAFTILRTLHF